ncbi:MAG: AAA family ATPase [Patescibacteria group bacterium]|nr:AAA family ATPase [Patescibacteria group bacterium]
MVLTEQQEKAIDLACSSVAAGRPLFRIGGYAGTGKTTLAKNLFSKLPGGGCCAFCGKACDVLRKKGLPSQTIHSMIYDWDAKTDRFWLKPNLPYNWIHLDEGSMVGTALWSDLQSYGIPIVVTGDPGQLEPVDDDDPHLMRDPDYVLDTIHRQAFNNPIVRLATEIRGGDDVNWRNFERRKSQIYDDALWADVIIVGYNKSRIELNKHVRKLKGFNSTLQTGERIVCKQNDKKLGIFNGMFFTVLETHRSGVCTLLTDDGKTYVLNVTDTGFHQFKRLPFDQTRKYAGVAMLADFGYAVTCHAFQGSEAEKVAYVDEHSDLWDLWRHRYTGATRAVSEFRIYKDKE